MADSFPSASSVLQADEGQPRADTRRRRGGRPALQGRLHLEPARYPASLLAFRLIHLQFTSRSRSLPRLTRFSLVPGRQIPTRRSSASPSGRLRTSSCRPISSPRCCSPSRFLSFLLLLCPVLTCKVFCTANGQSTVLLMVNRLYCFFA